MRHIHIFSIAHLVLLATATNWAEESPTDPLFLGVQEPLPREIENPESLKPGEPSPSEKKGTPAAGVRKPRPVRGLPFPIEAILEPNREGRVVMQYGERSDPPAIENLFDFRGGLKPGVEIQILVSSVSVGTRPWAVVNGRLSFLGQRVEGFNVVHVERDAVFMEKNGRIVRFPLGLAIRVEEAAK